ncbi:FUSC family protein [Saccharopolyspora sp. CA-218241]|uniref:FUSC family protein n=1 Tax=Saccharopolyspora sp. CA-218241 TaxID=3240027 RepID=UPI003D9920BA
MVWREWWNRFLASDPALRRLRTAIRVTLSVALTLAIMLPLLARWGLPLPQALLGAVVAINCSLGINEPDRRQQQLTHLLMPLPTTLSVLLSTATAPIPVLQSALFLVVIFAATYVRRFGSRWFPLGMVAFMGYFFTMFLRPQLAHVPALLAAAVCGALAALVLRFAVLRDDPAGVLARGRRTLRAQVHGLLHAVRDVAERPESGRERRALHDRTVRLNETALMLRNTVDRLETLDESGRDVLAQRILDVELAAENLLPPAMRLIDDTPGGGAVAAAIGELLAVLDTDPSRLPEATRDVAARAEQHGPPEIAPRIRRLGSGLAELAHATAAVGTDRGGAPVQRDDDEQAAEQTGLDRPEVRTAVQVTCAAAVAIVVGQLVAPGRWYWAVITAFVVFISAHSRGELLVRAWQRTAGTVLGVLAGILVASRITGDLVAEFGVILLCVFLGFYFAGYSYALLTFFITTMLGALYGMLGNFSPAVLEVRLLETAVGALAGVLAAVFVLPTRTRSLVRSNIEEFLLELRSMLRAAGTEIDESGTATGATATIRDLDDRLHQVVGSARPLTAYRWRSRRSQVERSVTALSGCAYYARNLAVQLPGAVGRTDAVTREALCEALWALADAVEAMTDDAQTGFDEAMSAAQHYAERLHDAADGTGSGPLDRTLGWLDRLTRVVADLARELEVPGAGVR